MSVRILIGAGDKILIEKKSYVSEESVLGPQRIQSPGIKFSFPLGDASEILRAHFTRRVPVLFFLFEGAIMAEGTAVVNTWSVNGRLYGLDVEFDLAVIDYKRFRYEKGRIIEDPPFVIPPSIGYQWGGNWI